MYYYGARWRVDLSGLDDCQVTCNLNPFRMTIKVSNHKVGKFPCLHILSFCLGKEWEVTSLPPYKLLLYTLINTDSCKITLLSSTVWSAVVQSPCPCCYTNKSLLLTTAAKTKQFNLIGHFTCPKHIKIIPFSRKRQPQPLHGRPWVYVCPSDKHLVLPALHLSIVSVSSRPSCPFVCIYLIRGWQIGNSPPPNFAFS